MIDADLRAPVTRLLREAGLGEPRSIQRLSGGANNRVFRIDTDARSVVLKAYFHHPDDPRDRLGAEYGFSTLAWRLGVRALPEPLAADPERRLGLYAFVPGRRLAPGEVGADAVAAATAFCLDVNRHRDQAATLPAASEACFRLSDHLATVDRRLARLRDMPSPTPLHGEARHFLTNDVVPAWRRLTEKTAREADGAGIAADADLPEGDRVLSPSDFGFHNALVDSRGEVRFLDFEYAGRDDPAKLVGDFFNQIAVPVPRAFYPRFRDSLAALTAEPERQARRFDLLLPVYTVKWIAIILNDFLPLGAGRRRFAGTPGQEEERLAGQLAKARAALRELKDAAA